jgi:hypothetical protein|tara:strand:- start:236 stop:625 length:390 start_codon:yes stop_codon:yes gene_type:complete
MGTRFTAKQQKEMKAERAASRKSGGASLAKGDVGGLLNVIPHPDSTKRPERKKVGGKYVRSKAIWTGHPSDPNKLGVDERYETRPEVLLRARKTYEKNTGRKAKAVKSALLYKDFTEYEKKEYKTLLGG